MKTSLIVSTYNQPEWLAKTLRGYACQTHRPDEVLIADDGSGGETRAVIERFSQATDLPLEHVWHEDRGFRKTEVLNRALARAAGDYLIFTDGDCVPRSDFVAAHLRSAKPGRFLSGGAMRLSMAASRRVTEDDIVAGRCFSAGWVAKHWKDDADESPPRPKLLKLVGPGLLATILNRLTPTRPSWNGNNASCFRSDALRVKGFDERMQYGGEDREFGERLVNLGLSSRQVRYTAVCVHLEHGRGYVAPEMIEKNLAIRAETRRTGRVETGHGLGRAA